MRISIAVLSSFLIATLGVLGSIEDRVEEIIRGARFVVGPDSLLNDVNTIRNRSEFLDRTGRVVNTTVMMFKRPDKLRVETDRSDSRIVRIVNAYQGVVILTDKAGVQRRSIRGIPFEAVQFHVDTVSENLNFYRGPLIRGGEINYVGEVRRMGRPSFQIDFIYPSGNRFSRFFDKETGRLISTFVNNGQSEIVEGADRLVSGGLSLPKSIRIYSVDGYLKSEVRFLEVEINPELPDSLFEVPEAVSDVLSE